MSWIGENPFIEERNMVRIFQSLRERPELLGPLMRQYPDAHKGELIALYFLRETGHSRVRTLEDYRRMLPSDRLFAFTPLRMVLRGQTGLPAAEMDALNDNPVLHEFWRSEHYTAEWSVDWRGMNYEAAARRNSCAMLQGTALMEQIGALKLGEIFTGANMHLSVQEECNQLLAPPAVRTVPGAADDPITPASSPSR